MAVELPIVSVVSALLVLVPLPWHWRTRNVCTASLILWLAACNIYGGINTIIWNNNADINYTIWCDIVMRMQVGANTGIPASILCICRRLAHVCSPYHTALSINGKRERKRFEIGMCVILPIIANALYPIIQINRFIIVEGFGCFPARSRTFPSLLIVDIPPILLSLASLVYAGVALRWLIHRRAQFLQSPQLTSPIPASGRYLRVVALTVAQMTYTLVMTLLVMMITIERGVTPWTSWEYVHENWHEIHIIPKETMAGIDGTRMKATWYFAPITSVNVFGYFGFDDRIISEYKSMLTWIKGYILCLQVKQGAILPSSGVDSVNPQDRLQFDEVLTGATRKDSTFNLPALTAPV